MQVGKGIERKEKEEKGMNRKTLESWEFWGSWVPLGCGGYSRKLDGCGALQSFLASSLTGRFVSTHFWDRRCSRC